MITALQAENAKRSATLLAHDQLIQAFLLRIAKPKKQVFGTSSEKIEQEIEQVELALEDLLIAAGRAIRSGSMRPMRHLSRLGQTRPKGSCAVVRAYRRRPSESAGNSILAPAVPIVVLNW